MSTQVLPALSAFAHNDLSLVGNKFDNGPNWTPSFTAASSALGHSRVEGRSKSLFEVLPFEILGKRSSCHPHRNVH